MASVGCSSCGYGMRVTEDENNIVHFLCKASDWQEITSQTADKKSLAQGHHRSDCIDMEYSDKILEAWMCPKCKSFTIFKKSNDYAEAVFTSANNQDFPKVIDLESHYIMYAPNTWYSITEACVPNNEIPVKFPPEF